MGSRTKNGPSVKSSGRGTGRRVSGRGRAVIYTRGWGPVSSARVVTRCAISDERAYARRCLETRLNGAVLVRTTRVELDLVKHERVRVRVWRESYLALFLGLCAVAYRKRYLVGGAKCW